MRQYCQSCRKDTVWQQSKALLNTLWPWNARRGQTVSRTGPTVFKQVLKCKECGRSVGLPQEK